MTPQQRKRVKELFEAVRAVPAGLRAAFWEGLEADREVRGEVESLLAAYDGSPEFLEDSRPNIDALPPPAVATPELSGSRIGPWRLMREVGRGGMGVVWEARRDDREYEARVAIKLLATPHLSEAAAERFREERQILARLDHPNIARLIDAGTSPDGYPYLVMDFVEGEAIDRWCEDRKATLRDRLLLFLTVCRAVEYAHRRLIVHRDLKPANILVTPDGIPKLLDFGIAQLTGAGRESHSGERALTPGYASPEQVRGGEATTANDIYSLGVLLYRLLTERSPYGEEPATPLEALRSACETTPTSPSRAGGRFARELRGELDAILLRALDKDPEQRYPSAAAFADDLAAWLEIRPVRAYPEPAWRRGVKFARRNRVATAAALVALVSLLSGMAATAWQAGIARKERNRAEARFRDVRQFSRSVLFELHDAIRNLPGATPARTLLLSRATEFLDRLAGDPGADIPLKLELAEGYRRLGHVQGSSFSDNIGRPDDAIASFRKAVRLGEQALAAWPAQAGPVILLMGAYDDLTDALDAKGDTAGAEEFYRKHLAMAGRADREPRDDAKLRLAVATSYSNLAYYRSQRNDLAGARQFYVRAVAVFSELERKKAATAEGRTQYAFALKRLGAIRIAGGALEDAELLYRTALDLETSAAAASPSNVRLKVDRSLTLSDLGMIAKRRNDLAGAAAVYEEVVRVRREAFEADRQNNRYRLLLMSAMVYLANTYSAQGRHREAGALCRESVQLGAEHGGDAPYRQRWQLAHSRVALVHALAGAVPATAISRRPPMLREAASELRLVARFIEQTPDRNLSPSDRGLRQDYASAKSALEAATAAGTPR